MRQGQLVTVQERLARPPGRIIVSSTPPGASVRVDGTAVGRAPAGANVLAYTHVKVDVEMPGYKPWSDRVYVRGKKHTMSVKLEAVPRKPGAKPVAKPKTPPKL